MRKFSLALVFNVGLLSLNIRLHSNWKVTVMSVLICALTILPALYLYYQRINASARCSQLARCQSLTDEELVELFKIIEGGFLAVNDLQVAMNAIASNFNSWNPNSEDKPDCIYNAHSLHLRCAVNPTGTCASCQHYQIASKNDL